MKVYNHLKIEKKWQDRWDKSKIYEVKGPGVSSKSSANKKKFYGLIEFPYPSGAGLHVGHVRSNTAMDIISRKRRMEGYSVLYPIGWDAFGLPTENYAIKTGIHPEKVTKQNTDTFRKQLKSIGFSFDWSREVNTTDPEYYKWTQWIFLQFFKKGLAYKAKTTINWCPKDKIGLANEEVVGGVCERCGDSVEKREKEQWMLAITKYADRLDKDLDEVDFLEKIKIQQRNWIGKSEGAEIDFQIKNSNLKIKVFTTRADTIFSATYVVLAPEHELLSKLESNISNFDEVSKYIFDTKQKDDISRGDEEKEKTGVLLKGVKAINPANEEEIPIFIADYVLPQYGTGAIMAVPAHDKRDLDFAEKYKVKISDRPFVDAKEIVKKVGGKFVIKFKLRDWVFSRQRYWGEPIPIINCPKCGYVPVPDEDLPVVLPKVKSYVPTDTGESPLSNISKWVNTKCPTCKGDAKRETDTMPNWAGSSWYYLRYTDPKNKKEFASAKNLEYFTPVDWYNGGMEHTTLHLLYSRFWHKFLYDLKLVPTKEPYVKRTSHGMILAEGGAKMSKSKGNTVDPKEVVKIYGADTLRLYQMFIGPFDQVVSWSTDSMIGPRRFLEKVWKISRRDFTKESDAQFKKILHQTIKKISTDIEEMRFNTAVSSMMILASEIESAFSRGSGVSKQDFKVFLLLLAPFAPHVTEELWSILGENKSIHISNWPVCDESLIKEKELKITIQINGKFRGIVVVGVDAKEEEVKQKSLAHESIKKFLENTEPKKIIYVKNRLINIVL